MLRKTLTVVTSALFFIGYLGACERSAPVKVPTKKAVVGDEKLDSKLDRNGGLDSNGTTPSKELTIETPEGYSLKVSWDGKADGDQVRSAD